jgi:hypothetical protein
LYPSIYIEDALPARELRHRFDLLEQAVRLLVEQFKYTVSSAKSDIFNGALSNTTGLLLRHFSI